MKKTEASFAFVNSSYIVFFTISAIAISLYLSTGLPADMKYSLPVLILFPLVVSLNEYLLNQLYSAGQIVLLYLFGYMLLPFLLTNTLGVYGIGILAMLIWLSAKIVALILEIVYMIMCSQGLFDPLEKRLVAIDRKVDRTAEAFALRNLSITEYKGFFIALLMLVSYYAMAFALLHR